MTEPGADLDSGDPFPDTDPYEDDDLLAPRDRPVNRLTVVLAGALLVALAFTGGALAQRQWGSPAAASAAPAGPAGFGAGGFPPGGFGAAPGAGGTATGAATGAGGGAAGGGTGAAANAPSVIGTVVSVKGTTLTVKNFAGKTVTVTVPEGTKVTSSTTVDLSTLRAGTTVSVVGAKGTDGNVTASAITTRKKETP